MIQFFFQLLLFVFPGTGLFGLGCVVLLSQQKPSPNDSCLDDNCQSSLSTIFARPVVCTVHQVWHFGRVWEKLPAGVCICIRNTAQRLRNSTSFKSKTVALAGNIIIPEELRGIAVLYTMVAYVKK